MSIDFYNKNAQVFFDETISVDMMELYRRFERHISKGSLILDAGCGSGRDSFYFHKNGYNVIAMDASSEMVSLARKHTGIPVFHALFHEFKSPELVDAIWACASLLHIKMSDMENNINNLLSNLKPDGIIYCSFKYGSNETSRDGRHFSNLNETTIKSIFKEASVLELWISSDSRPNRSHEKWINAIFKKQ